MKHDMQRYLETSFALNNSTRDNATNIRLLSHALEKGISLPNCRVGFGKEKVTELIKLCEQYNGNDDEAVDSAYGVLKAYINWQDENGGDTSFITNDIKKKVSRAEILGGTYTFSKTAIEGFENIAVHRHSLRQFSSTPVSNEDIVNAVKLAQTAPSACNRQPVRIYAVTDHKKIESIMGMHGGIRTMSSPTVIFVVAADRSLYKGEYERNTVYVDGGIFTMNLLYALDNFGIAACPAIWGNIPSDDSLLSSIIGTPNTHVVINLIVAGYYPDGPYKVPVSAKREVDHILKIL